MIRLFRKSLLHRCVCVGMCVCTVASIKAQSVVPDMGDVFAESFDATTSGYGGNDGYWFKHIDFQINAKLDNVGWTFDKEQVGAKACVLIGTKTEAQTATTPALSKLSGQGKLSFRAGAAGEPVLGETGLKVTIVGEGFFRTANEEEVNEVTLTLPRARFQTYLLDVAGANAETKIKFSGVSSADPRFFLDDVLVASETACATAPQAPLFYVNYASGYPDRFAEDVLVHLFAAPGTNIYYNMGEGDVLYKEPFLLTRTATLTAYATRSWNENLKSSNTTATYTREDPYTYYQQVTAYEDITHMGRFLVVNPADSMAMGYQHSNYRSSVKVRIQNNRVLLTRLATKDAADDDGLLREIQIDGTSKKKKILDPLEGSNSYLTPTSASGSSLSCVASSKAKSATFECTATETVIRYPDLKNNNVLSHNFSNRQFRCYNDGAQQPVQLYRKVLKIGTSAAVSNSGTLYADVAYVMPEGLKGYAVSSLTMADGVASAQLTLAYKAGDIVPAHTALLLHSDRPGTFAAPVTMQSVAAYSGENLLEGSRTEAGMAESEVQTDGVYYKLTTSGGVNPGFYWGAEGGASFLLNRPTAAYLCLPRAAGVKSLRLVFDNTSSIQEVNAHGVETRFPSAIYTLSGQAVSKLCLRLQSGTYVEKGKKFMVR